MEWRWQGHVFSRDALYSDVRSITDGHPRHRGKLRTSTRLERFDQLPGLNAACARVAMSADPTLSWTDHDTARTIVGLIESTDDADFSNRGLLAVKIMAGFRDAPDESSRLTDDDPALTWGSLLGELKMSTVSAEQFREKKGLRHLFAAPLYGGRTANHFQRDHPNFEKIADEFLTTLFETVGLELGGRSAERKVPGLPSTASGHDRRPDARILLRARDVVRVLIVPVAIATALVAGAAGTITAIPPASTEAPGGTGIVADAGPSSPTEIHTFVPGSSYDSKLDERPVEELSDADCWERSFVSARVDTILCALGGSYAGIIVDPCFRLEDEVAVCLTERDPFDSGDAPGILVRVASQIAPPSFVRPTAWSEPNRRPTPAIRGHSPSTASQTTGHGTCASRC